jgi:hypothetical protein
MPSSETGRRHLRQTPYDAVATAPARAVAGLHDRVLIMVVLLYGRPSDRYEFALAALCKADAESCDAYEQRHHGARRHGI